jgi:hypothetical protein
MNAKAFNMDLNATDKEMNFQAGEHNSIQHEFECDRRGNEFASKWTEKHSTWIWMRQKREWICKQMNGKALNMNLNAIVRRTTLQANERKSIQHGFECDRRGNEFASKWTEKN